MIVDFHTHIVPPWAVERRDELVRSDPLFGTLYGNPKARLATADCLLASMDECGIELSVALNIGWSDHDMCVRTNDYLLDAAARHPDRIVAFCAFQPLARDEATREIERCAKAGARGLGELRPDIQGFSLLDTPLLSDMAELARDRGLVVVPHVSEPVGHQYSGKGTITPDQLYAFASAFPEMVVVGAHWGGGLPFYWLMPEVRTALRNVYFDSAASPFLYEDTVFEHAAQIIGADKILFGSDFPLITQSRIVESVRSLNLTEEAKRLILGDNARRILTAP